MELVPIVELTLGIFSGLLLLTLIISYISYKLRKEDKGSKAVLGVVMANPGNNYIINPVLEQSNYVKERPGNIEVYQMNYMPDEYIFGQEEKESSEKKATSPRPANKFTVLNDAAPATQYGYIPETTKSFSHKFASSKTKDAFAMFR